jgi:hypothetical protein
MADAPVVHIGENSPEKVAYDLMIAVATTEGMKFGHTDPTKRNTVGGAVATRQWLLDTYVECLAAVKGERQVR